MLWAIVGNEAENYREMKQREEGIETGNVDRLQGNETEIRGVSP